MGMRARAARTTIAAAASGALLIAGSAQAAQVRVDRACYPGDAEEQIKISGDGYLPNTDYLLLLDNGVVGSGTADALGRVTTETAAPSPPESGSRAHDRGHKVEIRQGSLRASAGFRSARIFGDFNPGSGDPAKLRVRFSVFGFGIETRPGEKQPRIYVHYVDRKGKSRKTVALGQRQGLVRIDPPHAQAQAVPVPAVERHLDAAVRHAQALPSRDLAQQVRLGSRDAEDQQAGQDEEEEAPLTRVRVTLRPARARGLRERQFAVRRIDEHARRPLRTCRRGCAARAGRPAASGSRA